MHGAAADFNPTNVFYSSITDERSRQHIIMRLKVAYTELVPYFINTINMKLNTQLW